MDSFLLRSMEKELIMKKVVIIKNSAWAIYNYRLNLANYLNESGYEVVIVAPSDDHYCHYIKKEFEFFDIKIKSDSINPIQDIKLLFSIFWLYRKIKPDVVLNFTIKLNIYSAIAARLLGIPSINNLTGLGTVFIKENFITQIAQNLYRISLFCANVVFFQNNDDLKFFTDNKLVSPDKCSLLPGSGVDTNKFNSFAVKKHDSFKFLMVSRLLRDKGIYEYIEAAKLLNRSDIEFWILGESPSAHKTAISNEEIYKLSSHGIIKYFKRTDNVKSFLDKVDCVVLPSYREGCPRSILEASAVGLPVIVSDVPGCRQVVDNNITGLYCKVKDFHDLARKMEEILKMSKNERQKMGQMGRQKMLDHFDESIVLDRYGQKVADLFNKDKSYRKD